MYEPQTLSDEYSVNRSLIVVMLVKKYRRMLERMKHDCQVWRFDQLIGGAYHVFRMMKIRNFGREDGSFPDGAVVERCPEFGDEQT